MIAVHSKGLTNLNAKASINPPDELAFRPIPGFEEYYVTQGGRIFSSKTGPLCEMSPSVNAYGYLKVCLRSNGKAYTPTLHRLIALTFIPNPLNKRDVNHINGIKTDNRVINLEWASVKENIGHARSIGLYDSRNRAIEQMTQSGAVLANYSKVIDAHVATGIDSSDICRVCKGKQNHAGGFKWRYV